MHEVGLVEEAIQRATVAAHGAKIERLTFAITTGGHVTPDAVTTLFEALCRGTAAEGAELEFECREPEYACWTCGSVSNGAEGCPKCGSSAVHRIQAPELALTSIDVASFTAR